MLWNTKNVAYIPNFTEQRQIINFIIKSKDEQWSTITIIMRYIIYNFLNYYSFASNNISISMTVIINTTNLVYTFFMLLHSCVKYSDVSVIVKRR